MAEMDGAGRIKFSIKTSVPTFREQLLDRKEWSRLKSRHARLDRWQVGHDVLLLELDFLRKRKLQITANSRPIAFTAFLIRQFS
jgi:hypothetical protein